MTAGSVNKTPVFFNNPKTINFFAMFKKRIFLIFFFNFPRWLHFPLLRICEKLKKILVKVLER